MTRRPINYLDDTTAQSGAPVTWGTVREGCLNTLRRPSVIIGAILFIYVLWLVTNR